jgi:hypothetical protein
MARGFLARRQSWIEALQEDNRQAAAATRLQAVVRGFLARRQARRLAAATWLPVPARPSAGLADPPLRFPILIHGPVDSTTVTDWAVPSPPDLAAAAADRLVCSRQAAQRVSCRVLGFTAWVRPFPWDPGACRHLPPSALQLEDELVFKGGGDVMWSRQGSSQGHAWALGARGDQAAMINGA